MRFFNNNLNVFRRQKYRLLHYNSQKEKTIIENLKFLEVLIGFVIIKCVSCLQNVLKKTFQSALVFGPIKFNSYQLPN